MTAHRSLAPLSAALLEITPCPHGTRGERKEEKTHFFFFFLMTLGKSLSSEIPCILLKHVMILIPDTCTVLGCESTLKGHGCERTSKRAGESRKK